MTPSSTIPASAYVHRVRVYWEDTDAGGVVFYANYLKYFERARTEWLRSLGFSQEQLRQEQATMFVVTDTQVRYWSPARLDDELDVSVDVKHVGAASLALEQRAIKRISASSEGITLATGSIRIGCVDPGTLRPKRIPSFLADRLV